MLTYDQFDSMLNFARCAGAILNLTKEKRDHDYELQRVFLFETPTGEKCRFVWFNNLFTLQVGSLEFWLDDIWVDSNHPSFRGACLRGSHGGDKILCIGNRIAPLKETENVPNAPEF